MAHEIIPASRNQLSTQPPSLSQKSKLVMLLTKLNIRRQAKLEKPDLAVFAEDLLSYPLADIETALDALGKVERRDGETAFPSVATLIAAVEEAGRIRRIKASAVEAAAKAEELRERQRNGEKFYTMADVIKESGIDLSKAMKMDAKEGK